MVTFADLKKYVKIYPNLCCLTITSATTALAVYSDDSDDILFTLGGFGLGILEGSSVAAVSFIYYFGVEKGLKEISDLSILMLNTAYAGIATGSFLGLVTNQFFDVFSTVICNGLILVECSMAGMLVGHYVDYMLEVKKGNEIPLLTISTISGVVAGLVISKGIIYFHEIMENLNIAVNTTMKYSNEAVEEYNKMINDCNKIINATIEYPNKIREDFNKEINITIENFNETICTINTAVDYMSSTAIMYYDKAEEYLNEIDLNLIETNKKQEDPLFDFDLN